MIWGFVLRENVNGGSRNLYVVYLRLGKNVNCLLRTRMFLVTLVLSNSLKN